ncbi:DUF2334 domain-containing protein [Desulfogranum japonicum]|uniref:DUF2334 domain-containing protein n=1 Tax=Desulfogranum japonicum TaxID=231447 RepID=UPI0003F9639C|nr:DUF2334 domain-containing protein [Desulfogranum japonicum]
MKYVPSTLWNETIPANIRHELETLFSTTPATSIFFRVDDVGDDAEQFSQLMELFMGYQTPLCLAVVPAWINEKRWHSYSHFEPNNPLWSWHQHGYTHHNHETTGKKSEFGSSRTAQEVAVDIQQGRDILKNIMGEAFCPMFTPPWNRCSEDTLTALEQYGFQILSRSDDPRNQHKASLTEVNINVDLHTRTDLDAPSGWKNLLNEIVTAGQTGTLGFMLHHQRMNSYAFQFMEILLQIIQQAQIPVSGYKQFAGM